ncbi:hypothetical protein MRB53_009598 [Persea americana]|uniref:Uncharacterized protein n=1 Tax=Persea americana TaxID=3435 RepID=A0ACC2LQM7_PERAE|nr:hypothetical protein MRB53_009598 [Persea americana]
MEKMQRTNVGYMPSIVTSAGYLHELQLEQFQYFVVIDFEATCDKEKIPQPQEIIEFPSVLVNSVTGQIEGSFQTYVRPTYHPLLTDFCKELTGIQQSQVDIGVSLSEALVLHDKWLEYKGVKRTNFAVVTWTNWDCQVMLESECRLKSIRKPPYFNQWINLKLPFQKVFGGVRCNLKEAVKLAGLTWEGRAHCGLDDAMNTARLLTHLKNLGLRFSITNSLVEQCVHTPSTLHQPLPVIYCPRHADPASTYCFCGAKSSKFLIPMPPSEHGSLFYGCGNFTTTRGALCRYFERAYC